jgi:hypothetical protein
MTVNREAEFWEKELVRWKRLDADSQRLLAEWAKQHARKFPDRLCLLIKRHAPADVQRALIEVEEALAEAAHLQPFVPVKRGHGKTGATKLGRPPVWKGFAGLLFVRMVNKFRARRRCGPAHAIRQVRKLPPFRIHESIRRLSDRALEARYQEASTYWSLYLAPQVAWESVANDIAANGQRAERATQQLCAALHRWIATLPDVPEKRRVLEAIARVGDFL